MEGLLNMDEAAQIAGLSRQALYRYIAAGKLESMQIQIKGRKRKRRYITRDSLTEWLKERA